MGITRFLLMHMIDKAFIKVALECAAKAQAEDEVPVGAVLVHENKIIAKGWNQTIQLHDPTAHAEIVTLRHAGKQLKNYRLLDTTLYVTLEPCAMCVGALIHARVGRVVFGATEPKTGALGGAVDMMTLPHWNHRLKITGGVLAESCARILQDFFQAKRGTQHA